MGGAAILAALAFGLVAQANAGPREDADRIQHMLDAGQPQQGEADALKALAQAQAAAQPAEIADLNRLLGDALYAQKRYGEAEPFFREALSIREKIFGPEHAAVAQSATDLALTLKELGNLDAAEPLYRRALAIRIKALGPDHEQTARSHYRLARTLDAMRRFDEAAAEMGLAVAAGEKSIGPTEPTVVRWASDRAQIVHDTGDLRAAETAYRAILPVAERVLDANDLDLAGLRQGFANLLMATHRERGAEDLFRHALAARIAAYGPSHPAVAASTFRLAESLDAAGKLAEAASVFQQALSIRETIWGPQSQQAAEAQLRTGICLLDQERARDAEPFLRKALAIFGQGENPSRYGIMDASRELARALGDLGRDAEAETLLTQTVELAEVLNGPDHMQTGFDLLTLANHYAQQRRYIQAEPLFKKGIAILDRNPGADRNAAIGRAAFMAMRFTQGRSDEAATLGDRVLADLIRISGSDDPDTAKFRVVLAAVSLAADDLQKAETLATQALEVFSRGASSPSASLSAATIIADVRLTQGRTAEAIERFTAIVDRAEREFGPDSFQYRARLGDLARSEFAAGDFERAVGHFEKSAALSLQVADIDAGMAFSSRTGVIEDGALAEAVIFDMLIKTYDRLGRERKDLDQKAFLVAQRVIESQAANALSQMSARQASGSSALAVLVRERQDLVDKWRELDVKRAQAMEEPLGSAARKDGQDIGAGLASIDARLKQIDLQLAAKFPDFANLYKPKQLDFAAVQARLADNEVLLFYADTNKGDGAVAETYLWAVPRHGKPRWVRLALPTDDIAKAVHALRDLMGVGGAARGAKALGGDETKDRPAKVMATAATLHAILLDPVSDMIAGKALVVVASKSLSQLPFQLLVSKGDADAVPADYASARWLALDHAVTMLPSVAALGGAGGRIPSVAAQTPYLGFANPILTGRNGDDLRASTRGGCDADQLVTAAMDPADAAPVAFDSLFRGGSVDVVAVRALAPLPETVDEACAIAAALGARADAVHLGAEATEMEVRRLSANGELAHASMVHFATHGLVSGDLAGLAEPAIVLTPPDKAAENDDGLLTASEVSTLKLDADWVILSACNTAAGDGGGEALSGLARAFFYAGARSIVVSHWPVNSDAAVRLVTGAVRQLTSEPGIGRAEALRRSMAEEIARGGRFADPANWAPFILVGQSG